MTANRIDEGGRRGKGKEGAVTVSVVCNYTEEEGGRKGDEMLLTEERR